MDRKTFIKYAVLVIGSALVGFILLNTLSRCLTARSLCYNCYRACIVLLNDEKGLGYNELLASYGCKFLLELCKRQAYVLKAVNNLPDGLSRNIHTKSFKRQLKRSLF